jgi:hypothetical protein
MAEPTIPLMRSRRRIACPEAQDQASCIDDYSRDLRPAKWGSEASLHGNNVELFMSALGQKQTLAVAFRRLLKQVAELAAAR